MKTEAIEVLMNRRCVRAFKPDQVPDELLKTVLEAGTYAPTAMGKQSPFIVVVQNKAERDAVAALNAAVGGMPEGKDPYYGAPTIILVVAPEGDLGMLDAAAVQTNMLNAAYACGLDTCWIHRPGLMFDTDEGKTMLRRWGLDDTLKGVCSIALGYADCEHPAPKPRKPDYYRIIK